MIDNLTNDQSHLSILTHPVAIPHSTEAPCLLGKIIIYVCNGVKRSTKYISVMLIMLTYVTILICLKQSTSRCILWLTWNAKKRNLPFLTLIGCVFICKQIDGKLSLGGSKHQFACNTSEVWLLSSQTFKGRPQSKKSQKVSASGRNFLDPLPPSLKMGPTDEFVGISYLIVIIKLSFFKISTPPISPESRTSPIFTIEVAPKRTTK